MALEEHAHEQPRAGPAHITVQPLSDDTIVVTLSGDHDLSCRAYLLDALDESREEPHLIVDLTPCTFLDSTIMGVLLSTYIASQRASQRVAIVAPAPGSYASRALSVAGVADMLTMHASIPQAHAALTTATAKGKSSDAPRPSLDSFRDDDNPYTHHP